MPTSEHDAAATSRIHAWLGALGPWRRRGAAMLAGAAATLAYAPFQLTLLLAVAITVLVWLLDLAAARPRRLAAAFSVGWWFGFGHFATGLYWVSSAFMVDSDAWGPAWGIPAALALAGGMALFHGLGCALAMSLWARGARRLPILALCLFASEWLRGHAFGGFPWLLPGYAWTPGEPISQLASVFGIYGLSLVTLLACAAPATIADAGAGAGSGARFAPMICAALAVGLGWGWGAQRLSHAQVDLPGAQPIIRVADSGMAQGEKWESRPDQEWRVLQRYLEASGGANDSRAAILVWPEGAIPVVNFFMLENTAFMDALGRGLGDRALIVGLTRRENVDGELKYYNSAAMIDGVSGAPRIGQISDKHRLVPFGEFIPLWSLVSSLNIAPLQRIGAGFEAGPAPARIIVPEAPPAVALICYEAIFPGMIPRGAERPGWIVSVTNDAWFGNGSGPYQHYAMARYRSIEEGLPMARAAAGGISAIIDSYGRAVASTQGRGMAAEAQLPPALVETPYVRYGNIVLLGLLMLLGIWRFFPAGSAVRGLKS